MRYTFALLVMLSTVTATRAEVITAVSMRPPFVVVDNRIRLLPSKGGDIESHVEFFALVAESKMPVEVSGACYSSCTMVLGNPLACAMPGAMFGFHAARRYNKKTLEIIGDSPASTNQLWSYYSDKVRARLGRLTAEMVYIKGTDLLPACQTIQAQPALDRIPVAKPAERYNQASRPLLPALEPTRFYGKGF